MSNGLLLCILAIASYFIGSINFAILISKLKKKDIRSMGSGNPGTLNMSRNLGLKLGLLTFFLDICKGVVSCLVTYYVLQGRFFESSNYPVYEFGIFLSGLFAVLGHIYSIFLKFKGGKGIATTIGVFCFNLSVFGLGWASVEIMSIVCALIFIYVTEFGAMGSFIAITPPAIASSIRLFLGYYNSLSGLTTVFYILTNVLILLICFFTWFAHKKNIKQMLAGDEHPTSIKSMIIKHKAKKKEK